jgi:gamma-glutamyl hydrolase
VGGHKNDSACDSEDLPLPLNFTAKGRESRWMKALTPQVRDILAKEPVTMNNHRWGVYPSTFYKNPKLVDFFQIVSTNVGRKGAEFISTMEGARYPVYIAQWHAEKNQYEWNPKEAIPHTPDAIRSMAEFSDFMGSEARKSLHAYPTPADAARAVFYNYPALYSEPIVSDFEQCYVW